MAKEKRKYLFFLGLGLFLIYVFVAAQPIPRETILVARWLSSLESNYPIYITSYSSNGPEESGPSAQPVLMPFEAGNRFGYVGDDGRFAINQPVTGQVSLSDGYWTEYGALPDTVRIQDPQNKPVLAIENPGGYPLFLDNKIYILGNEQNSLIALDQDGKTLWAHDFPALLTCVDGAAGCVLAGTLDGVVELLDSSGLPLIPAFEPGGSRVSVILGCAISSDASMVAVISGIDDQRFLLLERSGDTYKVVYHEFLGDGFRRDVYVAFVENDSWVVYEREGGLGLYEIASRISTAVPLDGEIAAMDNTGGGGYLFAVTSLQGGSGGPSEKKTRKRFAAIKLPGTIVINAPFRSESAFFGRRGDGLFVGGDSTLAYFELRKN
ncbi:MAG: WD40 repeat domain-containing protein [Treponema sp.]|nr:WD40 repeat domain-containing protein [Treponema sp.]